MIDWSRGSDLGSPARAGAARSGRGHRAEWSEAASPYAVARRPERLVVAGVHRWTRNPMYLGWSLLQVGTALAMRSPGVLATWPIAALLVHRDVLAEERQLTDRFGGDYVAYAAAVPRYLLPRTHHRIRP